MATEAGYEQIALEKDQRGLDAGRRLAGLEKGVKEGQTHMKRLADAGDGEFKHIVFKKRKK